MKWLRCFCHFHKIIVIIIKALPLSGLLSSAKVCMYSVQCTVYCAIAWVVGEDCTTMEITVFRTFPIDLLWRLLQATLSALWILYFCTEVNDQTWTMVKFFLAMLWSPTIGPAMLCLRFIVQVYICDTHTPIVAQIFRYSRLRGHRKQYGVARNVVLTQ